MNEEEKKILENLPVPSTKYSVPIQWAMKLIVVARNDGQIATDYAMHDLFEVCAAFFEVVCFSY